jgi:predicted lipoprotein with Yx(FWY)xxD motif
LTVLNRVGVACVEGVVGRDHAFVRLRDRGGAHVKVGARIALMGTCVVLLLGGLGLSGASAGAPAVAGKHVGSRISLRHTADGKVLVGSNGHSLYTFSSDTKNHSNCGPACRRKWPPVTATGTPKAGAGVSASHLKVIKGHQVSYYGHPLYTYYKDTKAGQVKGEGLFRFAGYWYLVGAKGAIV